MSNMCKHICIYIYTRGCIYLHMCENVNVCICICNGLSLGPMGFMRVFQWMTRWEIAWARRRSECIHVAFILNSVLQNLNPFLSSFFPPVMPRFWAPGCEPFWVPFWAPDCEPCQPGEHFCSYTCPATSRRRTAAALEDLGFSSRLQLGLEVRATASGSEPCPN